MIENSDNKTAVLYNASCPVCSYEINHYAHYSHEQALPIAFDDLNDREKLAAWGIDPDTAARKLHVMKEGEVFAGIPAFIVLWQDMPRYRWLARIVSLPGVHWLACVIYDYVLAPLIYRWYMRRLRRGTA